MLLDGSIILLIILLMVFLIIVLIIKQKIIIGIGDPEFGKKILFSLNDDINFDRAVEGYVSNFEKFKTIYENEFEMIYNNKLIKFKLTENKEDKEYYIEHILDDSFCGLTIKFINEQSKLTKPGYNHIVEIHKIKDFSGSEMVAIALDISRKFGTIKTKLIDASKYPCGDNLYAMDLSIIKMLESGETYYTLLGFEFEPAKNKEDAKEILDEIKKIKSEEIRKYYDQLLKNLIKYEKKDILLIKKYEKFIKILDKYAAGNNGRYEYFYNLLTYLFRKECENFICLQDVIFDKTEENIYTAQFFKLNEIMDEYFVYNYKIMAQDEKIFYLSDGRPFTRHVYENLIKITDGYKYMSYACELLKIRFELIEDGEIILIISDDEDLLLMKFNNTDNNCIIEIKKVKSARGTKMKELVEVICKKFNAELPN